MVPVPGNAPRKNLAHHPACLTTESPKSYHFGYFVAYIRGGGAPPDPIVASLAFLRPVEPKLFYSEDSDIGSTGHHFVDLDEKNASLYSPSPETYLRKI